MRILALFFTVISFSGFGQSDTVFIRKNIDKFADIPTYQTDTIIFDTPNARNILVGNAILTQTYNQQVAKGYGLFLKAIEVADCKGTEPTELNEITKFDKSSNQWTIKTHVNANCCQNFLVDIKVDDENTLNLIYHNYGTYCFCGCVFELSYIIDVMDLDDLSKIESILINGDERTRIQIK